MLAYHKLPEVITVVGRGGKDGGQAALDGKQEQVHNKELRPQETQPQSKK